MRSATVSLGVAQALARRGVMEQADYMATVSGGGYFGASITSLCAEPLSSSQVPIKQFGVSAETFPYAFPGQHVFPRQAIDTDTAPEPPVPVDGLESRPLRHVREHASFLSRAPGLLDPDTWSAIGQYIASLVGTWLLMLLPLPTAFFMATMFIPVSVWDRFNPLGVGSSPGGVTWLTANAWVLTAPLWPLFLVLYLGWMRQISARVFQDDTSTPVLGYAWAKILDNVIKKTQFSLLLVALIAVGCVFMIFGLWGLHVLLHIQGGIKGFLGEFLVGTFTAGGLAAALASAYKLSRSGPGRRVLPVIGLAIGGYALLAAFAVLWYYFLWVNVFPSPASLRALDPDLAYKWGLTRYVFAYSVIAFVWSAFNGASLLNRLSLNFMYEQRIQQTWVISGNPPGRKAKKKAPPCRGFTMHSAPDLTLGHLSPPMRESPPTAPLQLVVTALNLQGSTTAALLDRKADSFVLSPIFCGSGVTGWQATLNRRRFKDIRLSQAAAISGAAVSPNMGMATHATLSIITTFLNIRLGAWVSNPNPPAGFNGMLAGMWERFPGLYWREMLGSATHSSPHVYLSDGGHFENLGVYELLRRRCKYIIAVDATGEPIGKGSLNFSGLGIPLRMARTDFGVEVDMDLGPLERDGSTGYVRSYFAVGRIRYPRATGNHGDPKNHADPYTGYLVLIKTGLVEKTLPPDIINYLRQVNPKFPYDSTLDQQFDQPQFESYRQLGFIAGRQVAEVLGDEVPAAMLQPEKGKLEPVLEANFDTLYREYTQLLSATATAVKE